MMRRKTFKKKPRVKSARNRIRIYQYLCNYQCNKVTWDGKKFIAGANINIMRNPNVKKENLCLNRTLLRKGWITKC